MNMPLPLPGDLSGVTPLEPRVDALERRLVRIEGKLDVLVEAITQTRSDVAQVKGALQRNIAFEALTIVGEKLNRIPSGLTMSALLVVGLTAYALMPQIRDTIAQHWPVQWAWSSPQTTTR